MLGAGLEPARDFSLGILSPLRQSISLSELWLIFFGEVAEWSTAPAWKVGIRGNSYRGFESLSLRHTPTDFPDGASGET